MQPSSRTPEGVPNDCPLCGKPVVMEPSSVFQDATCPHCGHLLRFLEGSQEITEGTREADDPTKQMRKELNRIETDTFRSRVDRYPTNLKLKYELGIRLKRGGQFSEAINYLKLARRDNKLAADVYLELGECYYHLKQYKLSLESYSAAIAAISERDVEKRKLALYRGGTLAYLMKDFDLAKKHLTEVGRLDFGYKDVAKWLEEM